ncbi:DUF4424 family protein [Thermodesulfobacteriota bacterium]
MSLVGIWTSLLFFLRKPFVTSGFEMAWNKRPTFCAAGSVVLSVSTAMVITSSATLIPASAAFANDSFARIGAGGITLLKTQHVTMVEEFLRISQKQINVRYRFRNDTTSDIHATVAFPLPTRTRYPEHEPLRAKSHDKLKRSFTVHVNGNPVATRNYRKAVVGKRDITPLLRRIGLSDKDIFEKYGGYRVHSNDRITWDLPKAQEAALERLFGEITRGEFPWKVAETMLWEQTFPAKKDIIVEHSYRPIPGGRYDTASQYDARHSQGLGNGRFFASDRCLDSDTRRAIHNRARAVVAKGFGNTLVWQEDVEYILGTGRNWKGPIGVFKLRIEKASADHFVSLCFPGTPKKISPTVFEFVEKNFMPPDKLVVNFYKIGPSPYISHDKLSDDEESLLWAAWGGDAGRVNYLLNKKTNLNAKTESGWTPLMYAAGNSHAEVVKLLLAMGAEFDLRNEKGWTALKLAKNNGHKEIVALLRAKGAKE